MVYLKNRIARFSRDVLNRHTGATYPDSSVTFGYDAIGRLTSVSDSVGGTITWTYDTVSSGHHPRVQETTTPGTVTVEYDEIGRRLKLSATSQTDVTYTYDKNSRLKTVTQGSQTVTVAYDDAGRRTSLTYPNGVVTSYGYDNANRLLSINHIKTPTTIEALTYQNDAAGNRITLTRANAAASLIPQAVTNTAFDAANEQTRFNSASTNLVYDNNGNLTSFTDGAGTTTYTWNARNQLTGISGPSLSASFLYDGLGRRTSKTINSATTGFWYDGADVLSELSSGTPTATYIRSLSIDEPFIRKQSGGDEFYQTDALGTTLTLTDGSGVSSTTYTQEPFGKTTKAGTSTNTFQYTGREEDGTGVMYYRARYYSPQIQRFLGEDPLGLGGGDLNAYAYTFNSPINHSDPSGEIVPALLAACTVGGLFSAAIDAIEILGGRKDVDLVSDVALGCVAGAAGLGAVRALPKLYAGLVGLGERGSVPLFFEKSVHATERLAIRENAVTDEMIQNAIAKGTAYWNPVHGSINYILEGGAGAGRHLLVGINAAEGKITTVISGTRLSRLMRSYMAPISLF